VERWNGGTVERRRPSHEAQFKSKALVFVSLVVVLAGFARFRAFLRVVIPMRSNLIGRESAWNKSRKQLARTRENPRIFSWG
jgi:hypothetical protein